MCFVGVLLPEISGVRREPGSSITKFSVNKIMQWPVGCKIAQIFYKNINIFVFGVSNGQVSCHMRGNYKVFNIPEGAVFWKGLFLEYIKTCASKMAVSKVFSKDFFINSMQRSSCRELFPLRIRKLNLRLQMYYSLRDYYKNYCLNKYYI